MRIFRSAARPLALLFCLAIMGTPAPAQVRSPNTQTISTSGQSITIPNNAGGMEISLEEIPFGSPATLSVVTTGCALGGTCDTLDTYTTVASSIRSPSLNKAYDHFVVTASWTGGTNPSVQINSLVLTANVPGGTTVTGLPSGTQGYPLTNSDGASTYATSALYVDASKFSSSALIPSGQGCGNGSIAPMSNDAAGQIQAAICAAPTGAVVDARSMTGGITFGSQPFANPNQTLTVGTGLTLQHKNITLLLPAGTIQTDEPIGVPTQSVLKGMGSLNTTLTPSSNFPSIPTNNCADGGVTHCYPVVCQGVENPGGSNSSTGSLIVVATGAHPTISCETPGASSISNSPRAQLEGFRVDIGGTAYGAGIANSTAQEKSWIKNFSVINIADGGIGVVESRIGCQGANSSSSCGATGPGDPNDVQNTGPVTDGEINFTGDCQSSFSHSTYGIYVNNGPSVSIGVGGHITLNGSSCGLGETPNSNLTAISASGTGVRVSGIHVEKWRSAVSLGGNVDTIGARVDGVTTAGNAYTNLFVSNAHHTIATATGLYSVAGGSFPCTNMVNDLQQSVTILCSATNGINVYTTSASNNSDTNANNLHGPSTIDDALITGGSITGITTFHGPLTSTAVVGTDVNGALVSASFHALSVQNNCTDASGSGTAYTCALNGASLTAPVAGDEIDFNNQAANTGAATLAINSTAAKHIKKWGCSTELISGDLAAGQWTVMLFDGTEWCVQGHLINTVGSVAGDGTMLSNTVRTGAVAMTLANAGPYTVWGNSTNASAAPGYTANPNVNSVVLQGGSSGSATLSVSNTGGTLNLGSANATVTSAGALAPASLSVPAAGTVDFSAITSTSGFKVPSAAGETAAAAGVLDFDTTNKNFHGYVNGADSIFANFASAPTTNVVPKASISSGNTLLVNSSITDNGTTVSTTEALAPASLSVPAAGTVDFSAITSTSGLKVPSAAGETAAAAGVLDFDTTNKNFHGYVNGADSIFANFAAAPTTNVIPKASISSGNTLMVNSSITDNGTTVSTPESLSVNSNFTVTTGGVVSKYNGNTTAGNGVPSILGVYDQTNQSATLTAQNVLASTPAAGHYRVVYYADENTGCATVGAAAIAVSVAWTDATHARNTNTTAFVVGTANTGTGAFTQATTDFWAASATAVTITATYTACSSGTWTYDVHAYVESIK